MCETRGGSNSYILAPYVNNDATRCEDYAASFNMASLQAARILEPTIDDLLKLFSI